MGDLGLSTAYGGQAASDAWNAIKQRVMQQRQQDFENQNTLRTQDRADRVAQQNDELRKAQLQSLQDERTAKIEAGKQGIANQVEGSLTPGESIDPQQSAVLRGALRGNLIQSNAPAAGGQFADASMPTDFVPGQQPGDVYRGNDKQRTDQEQKVLRGRLMADPNLNARERLAVEMENSGLKVPAGIFSNTGAGEIKDTGSGLARIGPDNTVTPILSGGKPVQGYHPPVQPIVVQTPTGPSLLNRGDGTATPITQGGSIVGPKPTAQQMQHEDAKKQALTSLDQLDQAIENAKDMIGPGAGRISSLEQMVGNADPRIAALGTKMLLAKMQVDAGIGGTRAAASPQLLSRWDNLLANHVTPEGLKAAVQAMREILSGTSTTSAKPTAADLIKKYGGS